MNFVAVLSSYRGQRSRAGPRRTSDRSALGVALAVEGNRAGKLAVRRRSGVLSVRSCWPLIVLAVWPRTVPAYEADELFQRVSPAVVLIAVSDGLGRLYGTASGVVVAPGEIVTNCHVIAGAARVSATQAAGGKVARATLHYADPERDLCQLSVPDKVLFARAVGDVAPLDAMRIGARVYAFGAPQGLELTLSRTRSASQQLFKAWPYVAPVDLLESDQMTERILIFGMQRVGGAAQVIADAD